MIQVRKSRERGYANHGWLESFHTFSFADYYDPGHSGFKTLRVINEDIVRPGQGFPTHGHRDMEIITYIVEGALEHKDSLGTGSVIKRGDVQRMSAGKGVLHSEFNASKDERVHLLQIWIYPDQKALFPSYEEKTFSEAQKRDQLCLVTSPNGENGTLKIHQNASIFASLLSSGKSIQHHFSPGRSGWVQCVKGSLDLNGTILCSGDGASVENEEILHFTAKEDSEFLFFDLE